MTGNVFEEYEAELLAKARADIAAEDAAYAALSHDEVAAYWEAKDAARVAETERQTRIAQQHEEMFEPDDQEDDDE